MAVVSVGTAAIPFQGGQDMAAPLKRENTRVWTIEDRAGPANTPIYQKNMKAASPAKNFGDVTRIEGSELNIEEGAGVV